MCAFFFLFSFTVFGDVEIINSVSASVPNSLWKTSFHFPFSVQCSEQCSRNLGTCKVMCRCKDLPPELLILKDKLVTFCVFYWELLVWHPGVDELKLDNGDIHYVGLHRISLLFPFFSWVLEMEPRTLHMLGKRSAPEPLPVPAPRE